MTSPHAFSVLPADLVFYASPPHACSYLPAREAVTLFADPHSPMNPSLYSVLAKLGFRRSGNYVYRPRCPTCDACRPARIPVHEFQPDRSQRRAVRRNQDLAVSVLPAQYQEEHYRLYRKYIHRRHADGGMDVDDPTRYLEFLGSRWMDTRFVEFRLQERLLMVAVIDLMHDGLSAVYTFFDPDEASRSLGTQAVLWQVEEARRRQLPYVYLGYWIAESPHMAYKKRFRPLEVYEGGRWQKLDFPSPGINLCLVTRNEAD